MKTFICTALLGIGWAAGALGQTATSGTTATSTDGATATATRGIVVGTVQTASGDPVAGATVYFTVRPSSTTDTKPTEQFYAVLVTDKTGKFTVNAVPAGKYAVCPTANTTTLLPLCAWESEPTVTVKAGQTITMDPIKLQQGVDLYLRVNDPNGTRSSMEGKVGGASLLTVVQSANGRMLHIPVTASDSSGSDHHLLVPRNTDLKLIVFSSTFALADQAGTAANGSSGLASTMNIPNTEDQHKVVVSVTGTNKSN